MKLNSTATDCFHWLQVPSQLKVKGWPSERDKTNLEVTTAAWSVSWSVIQMERVGPSWRTHRTAHLLQPRVCSLQSAVQTSGLLARPSEQKCP